MAAIPRARGPAIPLSTVLPQWSPDSAIDLMDSQEIATGILSLTAPGIVGWDEERATGDGAPRQRIHGGSRRQAARPFRQLRDAAASRRRWRSFGTRICARHAAGRWGDSPRQLCRKISRRCRRSSRSGRNSTAAKPSYSCIPGCHSLRRLASPARSSTTHSIPPERPSSSC